MLLSAIVITKNSADSIERCLTSLDFVDELIVVDSHSNDDTRDIASSIGAKVFTRDWQGYGSQKNYGASRATGSWLLFIDDDEEVTTELQQSIIKTINNPEKDFYWLRIVTTFLGRPLNHLFGHNPRLYRKSKGSWTNAKVHEQVENEDRKLISLGDNKSGIITSPLLHHSHTSIASYLKKMHHYTTLDAQQMKKTHLHRSGRSIIASPLLPIRLAARQFLKLLIYRKGILDGYPGLIWCILSAYYEFEMANKYLNNK